jgi:hypothetical protein
MACVRGNRPWTGTFGYEDAGYQRTAHAARIEANTATLLNICDLDTEKGYCNIYI